MPAAPRLLSSWRRRLGKLRKVRLPTATRSCGLAYPRPLVRCCLGFGASRVVLLMVLVSAAAAVVGSAEAIAT